MSISYKQALHIITSKAPKISTTKEIAILDSIKHISAQNIYATTALPPSAISLKDGYGVIYTDSNKTLQIVQNTPKARSGVAYEIATGEIIRENTSAIIPLEDALGANASSIQTPHVIEKNQHIKKSGEDVKKGELLLGVGEFIKAHSLAALIGQGYKTISVFTSPKVGILSIGDNLCTLQAQAKKGEIYNSNAQSIAARVLEVGASIGEILQCNNSEAQILSNLRALQSCCDFIITTGALSAHDAMRKILDDATLKVLFHRVKIAPATPSALSLLDDIPILHLPGLPLSCMLGFEILGVPALKTIKNENLDTHEGIFIKNAVPFACKESCTNAIPGYFDGLSFKSAPSFGAGMLNVLAKCNGYALIENEREIAKDELVRFLFF